MYGPYLTSGNNSVSRLLGYEGVGHRDTHLILMDYLVILLLVLELVILCLVFWYLQKDDSLW